MTACLTGLVMLFAFIHFPVNALLAQEPDSFDFDQYTLLQSSGEIPQDLLQPSSEKYRQRQKALKTDGDPSTRATRDKFILQSSFMIDELLLGGNVLFNDPVGEYLNQVKDYLLKDQPELREQTRIFVVKSPSPNAFATNDGTILINMGLLAKVTTEAELAFSICHELQHYLYRHPMRRYVATEQFAKERAITPGELARSFIDRNQYSREQETEADDKGMDLYLGTDYALEAVDQVFLVLRDAAQPYRQLPWDFSFFETENLKFPANYRLDSLSPIKVEEDADDSKSSHPNIATRRKLAAEKLAGKPGENRSQFIVSEEKFRLSQKISRFEIAHLYLEQRRYEEAIYHAYLLLADEPGSFYLQKIVAQALYGLARHKNDRNFYAVHTDHDQVEGAQQQLNFFFGQMEKAELNVLALDWSWRIHRQHPEDRELAAICIDLMDDFFRCHREIAESMSHQAAPDGFFEPWQEVAEKEVPEDLESLEDFSGSLEMLDEMENKATTDYFQHAFAAYFRNPEFVTAYQNLVLAEPETNEDEYLPPRRRRRQERRKKIEGEALGIDKVVFVEPAYKRIDERKRVEEDYIGSEKAKDLFLRQIKETAGLAGLQEEILSNRDLEADEMARLNDLAIMEHWIADYMRSRENQTHLVNLFADEAREIAEKYGSDHFAYTGVVMITRRKKAVSVAGLVVSGILIIPLPLVIVALATPRRSVFYLNLVFDVERNELVLEEGRRITTTPYPFIIKSHLYSSMHQMKLK